MTKLEIQTLVPDPDNQYESEFINIRIEYLFLK